MILLVHHVFVHVYFLLVTILLATMCAGKRQQKLHISPLKYDPDDPSTFPPSEMDKSIGKRNAELKKNKKTKVSEKKPTKSLMKSFSDQLPMPNLREANDMETVNDMVSAWGAVQVQEQDAPTKMKGRSEMLTVH